MVDHGARGKGDGNLMCNIYDKVTRCALEQVSNKLPEKGFSTQEALASSWHH